MTPDTNISMKDHFPREELQRCRILVPIRRKLIGEGSWAIVSMVSCTRTRNPPAGSSESSSRVTSTVTPNGCDVFEAVWFLMVVVLITCCFPMYPTQNLTLHPKWLQEWNISSKWAKTPDIYGHFKTQMRGKEAGFYLNNSFLLDVRTKRRQSPLLWTV